MTTVQQEGSFLRERPYIAIALTHFFVDILNSSRNLLMALLAISLGLTNAQLGINLLIYNIGASLTQPFFGWLADRIGPRWLIVGGMGWMTCFYVLASLLSDWPALIALTMAGLGSGSFHPTGAKIAGEISQKQMGKATAVFFMSGQLGLFVGPVLAGLLLEANGRPAYLVLPVLSLTAFVAGWQWITQSHLPTPVKTIKKKATKPFSLSDIPPSTIFLFLIILTNSSVSIASATFAPKLFAESGFSESYIGWMTGLYMLGSAIGGVIGGTLADRLDSKWVIIGGFLGGILPLYFYIPTEGAGRFILLTMAGLFGGMPHSIIILRVQALMPGRKAMASGLALGVMFFSGSVGSFVLGGIADNVGLAITLQGTAVLPLIAATLATQLPRARQAST